jgi:hypothetical protein
METIKVKTQKGLDKALGEGKEVEVKNGFYTVKQGFVILWENASAELRENASAELRGNASATLWGNARAELWGNARAELWGNASATLWENASATLRGNASAELRGNASAELWENARAELRGNARATLRGNARATLRGNARAEAWNYSSCILLSPTAKAEGNILDLSKFPLTPKEWLDRYHIPIKSTFVVLYKATNDTFETRNGIKYIPGTDVIAPDWEDINIECGNGLHFCPRPSACKQFNENPFHFVACKIAIKDIRVYQGAPNYPDKIRAQKCKVLYECDIDGNKIEDK